MTINVFRFWYQGNTTPLTAFAETLEAGEELQRRWSAAHQGEKAKPLIRTEICAEGWLDDRPQWKRAVELGEAGVGHWMGHSEGWVVEAPETVLRGPLGPLYTPVRLFVASLDGEEHALIFAMDELMAANTYLQWHNHWFNQTPRNFELRPQSRWKLTGPEAVLREEMDARICGIAGWSEIEGWHIYPPEDAMAQQFL